MHDPTVDPRAVHKLMCEVLDDLITRSEQECALWKSYPGADSKYFHGFVDGVEFGIKRLAMARKIFTPKTGE